MARTVISALTAVIAFFIVNDRESAAVVNRALWTFSCAFPAGNAPDLAVFGDRLAPERIHTSDVRRPEIGNLNDNPFRAGIDAFAAVKTLLFIHHSYAAYDGNCAILTHTMAEHQGFEPWDH